MNWNLIITIGVIFIMVVVGYCYYRYFVERVTAYCNSLKALVIELSNIDSDDFSTRFEDINEILKNDEYVSGSWKEFSSTLIPVEDSVSSGVTGNKQVRIYSTQPASDYFNLSSMARGIDIAFWQNAGAFFTGLGIFGTFLGLTIGLYGTNFASSDVDVLKEGIQSLLGGVGMAFLTSLVGVFAALVYNGIFKYYLDKLNKSTNEVTAFIEKMYPSRVSEYWLMELLQQNKKQSDTLSAFSTELVTAIGDATDDRINAVLEKFVDKLTPTLDSLRNSIDQMGKGGAEVVGDRINNGIGSELQGFAKVLSEIQESLAKNMKDTQELAAETNKKFVELTEKLATDITNSSAGALRAQNEQMNDTFAKITELLTNMEKSTDEAGQRYKGAIEEVAVKQKNSMEETCEAIKNVLTEVNANIQIATEKMVSANEAANATLAVTIGEIGTKAKEMSKDFDEKAIEQVKRMTAASDSMNNNMELLVNKIQNMLDKHNKVMSNLYNQHEESVNATNGILRNTKEFAAEIGAAATPVKDAADSLKERMTEAVKATNDFNSLVASKTNNVLEASHISEANLQNLIRSLEETKVAWKAYENNFKDVSGELNNTFEILTSQTKDYNSLVSSGLADVLRQYDEHLKHILEGFQTEITDLQEGVDDLLDAMNKSKQFRNR